MPDQIIFKHWPRLMTVPIAAEYIGFSEGTLRNMISNYAKKPFPVRPKRIGRKVLFDRKELDAWVDGLK